MLQHLYIQNYALIEKLDIDFESGFSVITGETGAGKSILLGAIGLLLGQRADTKAIRQGAQRCIIEATFNLEGFDLQAIFEEMDIDYDGAECIIRRELTATGKTRAFINDTPANVAQLKTLGEHLIDIHSQHQNLLLSKEDFQMGVLDVLSNNQANLQEYRNTFQSYKTAQKALAEARRMAEEQQEEQDYIAFQLQQLEEAELQEGEDEELEQEQQMLEHAEEIKRAFYQASELLNSDDSSIIQSLRSAHRMVEEIINVFPSATELAERLDSCRIELKDIADELESECEHIEYNPERQAFVDERLSTIYDLERKHHVESVSDLITLTGELSEKLDAINHSEENILEYETRCKELEKKLLQQAKQLTEQRKKAAKQVEDAMCKTLIPLGMPNVQFQVEVVPKETADATGMDKITFRFSANKNTTLQPISQIASGGEIARVMLSLKALISGATSLPTIIFDEIDTGVSGQIAERMALIMKEMGEEHKRQVISITHLPQIAALGAQHYRVYKEDSDESTNSHIVRLTKEQRVEEIAHMLSGATITEAAMNNARELLKI